MKFQKMIYSFMALLATALMAAAPAVLSAAPTDALVKAAKREGELVY